MLRFFLRMVESAGLVFQFSQTDWNWVNLIIAMGVAGVQGLVEVEEDLLGGHLLELEILEGRPELYAQGETEDPDCWGVNHNQ